MQERSWSPVVWIGYAMCVGVMGTALASPLYPLYQQAWGLQPSHITQIFVAYMFGALASLLFLGRLTDRFGFLAVLRAGLILMTLSIICSALAWNVPSFAFARFLIGIASGLISTSAMLGLIYTIPDSHKQSAPQLSSIITVIGFGLGPLIGGIIAQFSAKPLMIPYLPVIAGAIVCLISLFSVKHVPTQKQPFSIKIYMNLQSWPGLVDASFFT